jgi:ethanolamine ammonia-lyase small subunit
VPERPDSPADPWAALRAFTPARLALGHAGAALPTSAHLEFQLAHARARDAVHHGFDAEALSARLSGVEAAVRVRSAVSDRTTYLQRPDLGRRLDAASRELLAAIAPPGGCDGLFVVADGLSPLAVERHAAALLARVTPVLLAEGWRLGPVVVAEQGRVALGDEIGAALQARLVAVLIGERPGLSSPDSMGVYLTWEPRPGRRDAERNCLSNIRTEGLGYDLAAHKLLFLMREARRRRLSGIALKDEAPALENAGADHARLAKPAK